MNIMFKGTIILAQRHDYILKKYSYQRHDYSYERHDYSCSKARLSLLKNTIIISGRTKIKSGCTESNAKTCISTRLYLKCKLFIFSHINRVSLF